jgi:hypothetical protein
VVIPSTHKDAAVLSHCIKGIKQNCQDVRRIIVISKSPMTTEAEWISEEYFPFTKEEVALYLNRGNANKAQQYLNERPSRVGWYFQQLLKFYAAFNIPNISSNVLIVDSDTIFLRPVSFLNHNDAGIYNLGVDYHRPYFEHAAKLVPGFKEIFPGTSAVCHHMLFQREVLKDLFKTVEDHHQMEFWQAFCLLVDPIHLKRSGASEYEIYFNFVFSQTDQVYIRQLSWSEMPSNGKQDFAKMAIYQAKMQGLDYVSCHNHE